MALKQTKSPSAKPWKAHIKVDGKKKHLGVFATEEEAAKAYDVAAKEYHMDGAILNFNEDGQPNPYCLPSHYAGEARGEAEGQHCTPLVLVEPHADQQEEEEEALSDSSSGEGYDPSKLPGGGTSNSPILSQEVIDGGRALVELMRCPLTTRPAGGCSPLFRPSYTDDML